MHTVSPRECHKLKPGTITYARIFNGGAQVSATDTPQSKWCPDWRDGSTDSAGDSQPYLNSSCRASDLHAGKTSIHIKIKSFKVEVGLRRLKKNKLLSPA